jgi:hypothetical protein
MQAINGLVAGILALALVACGGGGGSSSAPPPAPPVADGGDSGGDTAGGTEEEDACGVAAQIDFVEAVTDSWYLWYDEMTNVEKSDYASAQAYLDARLKPLLDDGRDRGFSYMTTITGGRDQHQLRGLRRLRFSYQFDRYPNFHHRCVREWTGVGSRREKRNGISGCRHGVRV